MSGRSASWKTDNEPWKSWAFTLNNYSVTEVERFKTMEKTYLVFSEEVGESGTPHLQGTIIFRKTYRRTALSKIFPRAHWEKCLSDDHSINYCMKGDNKPFIEDNRVQGKRSDIDGMLKVMKESGIKKVSEQYPHEFLRFHSGLEKMQVYNQLPRNFKPHVTWVWGPTGSGKTRSVFEKEDNLWISGKDLRWWNGYENQEATLFDDFRGDFCTYHELLRILDRYPYTVEVKHGHRQLNSQRMYITSCHPPDKVYSTREDINQLLRRIDEIILIDSNKHASQSSPRKKAQESYRSQDSQEADQGDR